MSSQRLVELVCAFMIIALAAFMLTVAIRTREGVWLYLCAGAALAVGWSLLTNKEDAGE